MWTNTVLKGIMGASLMAIAMALLAEPPVYGEETADPAGAVTQPAADQKLTRREKIDKWLENHPKFKEKADTDGDGKIGRDEFRAAREKLAEHRREVKKEKAEQWLENHPNVKDRVDRNDDGQVDRKEWKYAKKRMAERRHENGRGRDYDNNPPGRRGGPGTNWENRPGPQGGWGASPDRGGNGWGRRDFDNNPPGRRGGPGTNWENRPGPQGGWGSGPDRRGWGNHRGRN